MIVSKLQGGLGNQMFQWAVAKSYSVKYNTDCYFDANFFNTQNLRKLQLNEFKNIELKIVESKMYSEFNVSYVNDTFNYNLDSKKLSKVSQFDLLFINGYWQSEKYFIENEDIIRQGFVQNFELDIPFIDSNTVSLHVRRTDYVSSNGYHPVQDISYYENAIDIISDYDNLVIFSDDIQWCKDNLKFRNMIFLENFSDIQDMYIMSLCKNNIIANSSFSWWGSWLNNNPDKIVIAPSKWFGDRVDINQSDIIPEKWIKI